MTAETKSTKRCKGRSQTIAKGEIHSAAFSIDDIAAQTDLSRRTIYLEIASGRLQTIKIRGRRLVLPQQRDAWLRSYVAEA